MIGYEMKEESKNKVLKNVRKEWLEAVFLPGNTQKRG